MLPWPTQGELKPNISVSTDDEDLGAVAGLEAWGNIHGQAEM